MITIIDDYSAKGCGRCERFATADCSTQQWKRGLAELRRICLKEEVAETVKRGHPCFVRDGRNIAIMGAVRGGVGVRGAPRPYDEIVGGLPPAVRFGSRLNKNLDMVHVFVADAKRLPSLLDAAKAAIKTGRHDLGFVAEEELWCSVDGHRGHHPGGLPSDGLGRCEGLRGGRGVVRLAAGHPSS